jgi:hypothetical protein
MAAHEGMVMVAVAAVLVTMAALAIVVLGRRKPHCECGCDHISYAPQCETCFGRCRPRSH